MSDFCGNAILKSEPPDRRLQDVASSIGETVRALKAKAKHAMSKRQLIDDIRRLNPTAMPQFLAQFDEEALKQYLEHLQAAELKHIRIGGWVRRQPKLRLVS
jgi:hypothetical protein